MLNRGLYAAATMTLALTAMPARACEHDPFLFQLPGETEAQAKRRSEEIFADYRVKERFDREKRNFDSATLIYLARVVSKGRSDLGAGRKDLPTTSVHPMASFKGALPMGNRTLIDELQGGMCTDVGDGRGATSSIGDLVVIFEGVQKTVYRPRGIDSLLVSSIRNVELLDWLRRFGKDLED